MEISHEEFITILKEKDKYEKIEDNLRSQNEKYELLKWLLSILCHQKKIFFSCVCRKCLQSLLKHLLKTVFIQ